MRTVADAMLSPPVTVSPAATVQEASNAMLEGRTHAVVVADDRGRVLGVASADDVARALAAGRDATLTPIADVLEDAAGGGDGRRAAGGGAPAHAGRASTGGPGGGRQGPPRRPAASIPKPERRIGAA